MGLFFPFRRKPHERTGFLLYSQAVAAARQPWFYGALAVPDTLDGRFDTVGLFVGLLIHRLRRDADPAGAALAQAVFDAMFSDMDVNLREMGVGDLSVGKKVKAMWNAFHGRAMAYEPAIEAGDAAGLAAALERNLWRRGPDGEGVEAAATLAAHALAVAASLADQPLAVLLRGEVTFLPPPGGNARAL